MNPVESLMKMPKTMMAILTVPVLLILAAAMYSTADSCETYPTDLKCKGDDAKTVKFVGNILVLAAAFMMVVPPVLGKMFG